MTREEVILAVKDIIATIAPDEELDGLNETDPLRDQIELDSMDFLDIVMELRKRYNCLLYTSPSPRDLSTSRMPSSA